MGKRLVDIYKDVNTKSSYKLIDAIDFLKNTKKCKFNETVEIAMRLNIDPKKNPVRGMAPMPSGTGKKITIAVICSPEYVQAARDAGADIVGSEDLIERIKNENFTGFDLCIADPAIMGTISKIAKILGPRNLMPNPKTGTVTNDIPSAIKMARQGQVDYRADTYGIVHAAVGKVSFETGALIANISSLVASILQQKADTKGNLIKSVSVSSTMGPGLKVNIADLYSL